MTPHHSVVLITLLVALGVGAPSNGAKLDVPREPPTVAPTADDVLARSGAVYASLQSYADVGNVVIDNTGVIDRYKFKTYFRRQSHDLYFEFQGVSSYTSSVHYTTDLSGHHEVAWMRNHDLQTFDFTTKSLDHYPPESNQAGALNGYVYQTRGTSTLIASLLYPKATLGSTLQVIREIHEEGTEDVDGHKCYKLVGTAADQYAGTGRVTNVRPVTVWVDAQSLLLRKLFEGTPKGAALDSYHHYTVTIDPQADPKIDDSKFEFTVPSYQK